MTTSDKIDGIVTNRFLGFPIFFAVMALVYYVSVSTVGGWATDWVNDGVFADGWNFLGISSLPRPCHTRTAEQRIGSCQLRSMASEPDRGRHRCRRWRCTWICAADAGTVSLFSLPGGMRIHGPCCLYYGRIFRKFGLSGKSFIPMQIGTGCGVPGIMASRTIENDRDRKMTIMTTTFIPCSAKLPIIALIAGACSAAHGGWHPVPTLWVFWLSSAPVSF